MQKKNSKQTYDSESLIRSEVSLIPTQKFQKFLSLPEFQQKFFQ